MYFLFISTFLLGFHFSLYFPFLTMCLSFDMSLVNEVGNRCVASTKLNILELNIKEELHA